VAPANAVKMLSGHKQTARPLVFAPRDGL